MGILTHTNTLIIPLYTEQYINSLHSNYENISMTCPFLLNDYSPAWAGDSSIILLVHKDRQLWFSASITIIIIFTIIMMSFLKNI